MKQEVFEKAISLMGKLGLEVVKQDRERPWGGFLVINEDQAKEFATEFFPEENLESLKISGKLSPKILLVAPEKRLSWQYHFRRAEIWRCIEGEVAVATSLTDKEQERVVLKKGDKIKLQKEDFHA